MKARQAAIDRRNAAFWDELCGSTLARQLRVTDRSPANLKRLDLAYLEMYQYLDNYLPTTFRGERVLEIGLGYGTVGQVLAERGADYHGLDIASGPVEMMRYRLGLLAFDDADDRVECGSALNIPHPDGSFQHVVSIGCLHHTGNIPSAIAEIYRVLQAEGRALVMLYNKHSFRQFRLGFLNRLGVRLSPEDVRAAYDTNKDGSPAPVTEFVSRREALELFHAFTDVRVSIENFDDLAFAGGRLRLPRRLLLANIARLLGLDLYIVATKPAR